MLLRYDYFCETGTRGIFNNTQSNYIHNTDPMFGY